MNNYIKHSLLATSLLLLPLTAWAESMEHRHDSHAESKPSTPMDHSQHEAMATDNKQQPSANTHLQHSQVPTSSQQINSKAHTKLAVSVDHGEHHTITDKAVDHKEHTTMPATAKQPEAGKTRSADYSNGQQTHASHHMNDNPNFWSIDAEALQLAKNDDQYSGQYDIKFWYGNSENRVYLNNSGEFEHKNLQSASSEIAWWRALSPYWNTSLGFRQDYGHSQRDQSWVSTGINGVAPYWFDVGANLYVSKEGDVQLKLSSSYDLYITQKVVFQPEIEGTFFANNNAEYQYGSGLSSIESGFKLRYDITPQLSPYIGFDHERMLGKTADYVKQHGEATHSSQALIGLRFWY